MRAGTGDSDSDAVSELRLCTAFFPSQVSPYQHKGGPDSVPACMDLSTGLDRDAHSRPWAWRADSQDPARSRHQKAPFAISNGTSPPVNLCHGITILLTTREGGEIGSTHLNPHGPPLIVLPIESRTLRAFTQLPPLNAHPPNAHLSATTVSTAQRSPHKSPPPAPQVGRTTPPLRTYFDRRWNSFFPRDVLLEIFQYLRETSALRQAALWSEDELGEMRVGPLVAEVAHVCRFWRQVALSSPSLWDGIPIALESGRILSLANPGQIEFYRDMSSQAPLRLAIGTRSQLSGRGVHIQETPFPYPINILCDIAPRITELTISFDYRSMLLADLVDLSLSFDKLERLTLIGAAQSPYLLERAGFWKSPCMKSVAAAISESSFSFRLFGEIPWAGLREVLIGDEWDCALSSAQVHTFLARAANITKFQCRLRDAKVVGEDTEKRLSLPTLYHHDLRELTLTFHDYYASPALLSSLVCPNLERFSFKMDWSANFNPSSVPRWLCTASHSRLTRFECLASVDLDALIESVVSMPLLQVLKCHGPVASSYLSLAACPLKSVIDDRLLHALSGCLSGSDTSGPHCVQLRELWIKNAYFSNQGIGTFLEGRLSGKEPRVMLGQDDGLIYKIRRVLYYWKNQCDPRVQLKVHRYLDDENETLAGLKRVLLLHSNAPPWASITTD
ncbi:hypothetical protein FA13DRAFT_1721678 [Coprinellus micaceus]|uniref:F-box domain-containing protein n=1 Tax=Coprinellus micaceus TaxID=71717 RepID=A0A4Y7S0F1_COPMI|nr:hypothetical protein FA13DRAFT_1721678 [Coprinellus micaceus]